MNAEFVLRSREAELKRSVGKLEADQKKEKKVLLKLMKLGDEEMINGQAELVANLEANIKSMTRSQQRLHIFGIKIKNARITQSIGTSMIAVSKALGRVSSSIQLEKVEAVMTDLGKQYEDIDVMTDVLNTATTQSTARDVPHETIDRLKRQVADEAGFELSQELNSAEAVKTAPVKVGPTEEEEAKSKDSLRAIRAAHEM